MKKIYRLLEEIDFEKYIVDEKGIYSKYWKHYLSGKTDSNGYVDVSMNTKDGHKHQYPYNRIIGYCLISKPEHLKDVPYEYLDVDHINGIRNDNRPENLRWCTHAENIGFELARQNKSKAMKGVNSGENNGNYGKVFTEEEKQNLSKKLKNRSDLSKKVTQYTLKGELIGIYPSAMEAARQTGLKQQSISRVCLGERHTYKDFIWKYE